MKKILISPGCGAGWSTWNGSDIAKYMLTYQPIIDFLEGGGQFKEGECDDLHGRKLHPLLAQLRAECKTRFGEEYVCTLGAKDLVVQTVDGPFRVTEYGGNESLLSASDLEE